jgi:hypothetical protein
MILSKQLLAALALALLGLALPAPARSDPKDANKPPALPFPLPNLDKLVPPGLDPAQARLIQRQLEMTRKILGDLNKQLPGGLPPGIGGVGGVGNGFPGGRALGRAADNRLGVGLQPPGDALADQLDLPKGRGLLLGAVRPGSAADRAGLKNHDILLEVGGKAVPSEVRDFVSVLNGFKTGDKVDVVVLRKGKRQTIKGVTLPDPPPAARVRFPGIPGGLPNLPVPNIAPPLPNVPGFQGWNPAGPAAPAAGRLAVAGGKAQAVPTAYSGSVRIRALPDRVPGTRAGAREAVVVLDVAAEPRLEGARVSGTPVITRALDDQGQNLTVIPDADAPPNGLILRRRNGLILRAPVGWGNGIGNDLSPYAADGRQAVVRLKRGDKQAKALKELTGRLPLEVLLPPEPMVAVNNVLKAAGRTFRGKDGSSLEVLAVEKLANGDYQVKVKLDRPADANNPMAALGPGGRAVLRMQALRGVQINGNNVVLGGAPGDGGGELPVLLDGKGKALARVNGPAAATRVHFNGLTQSRELTLVFRQEAGQGEPARLVQSGRRRQTFQVPFTLRDVPLP